MFMTEREKAMEFAREQGYRAFPYGRLPELYKGDKATHLAEAWNSGWKQKRQESQFDW